MGYTCPRCGYQSYQRSHYVDHLNKKNTCIAVLDDVPVSEILDELNKPKAHQCALCDKSFAYLHGLQRHAKGSHRANDNIILKNTREESQLKDEVQSQNADRIDESKKFYDCPRCGYRTNQRSHFVDHLKKKKTCPAMVNDIPCSRILEELNKPKAHHCTYCDKTFVYPHGLWRHIRTFHTDKPQIVNVCRPKNHETIKTVIENKDELSPDEIQRIMRRERAKRYIRRNKEKYKKARDEYNLKKFGCKTPHCPTHARLPKYQGYCCRCFMYTFPDTKISRNYKVKEKHVQDFLSVKYQNEEMLFDKRLGGCSRRRPDCFIEKYTHSVIIEIDENQHTDYNTTCEEARINELYTDLADRPIIFIRFNPDGYVDENGEHHKSSFKYHKNLGVPMVRSQKEWDYRLRTLQETVDRCLYTIPIEPITTINLFFDADCD